jgi:cell wall-associated NlpC family hydrolase
VRPGRADTVRRLAGALLAAAALLACLPAAHADPSAGPAADLADARGAAARLRAELDLLDAKTDRASERLAHTRDLLAEAAQRSIGTEERLDGLSADRDQAALAAADHVRDVYRMGGVLGVYGSVLAADTPAEMASRYAAVQAVLGQDVTTVADADQRLAQVSALHDELARLAADRTQLVVQARTLAEELAGLRQQTAQALADADRRVRTRARQLAAEQAAAAEAAAAAQLSDLGVGLGDEPPGTPYAAAAIQAALSVLGSPYVWGAEGPDTFDCSGLVQWAYARAGLVLPRLADDQYFASTPVPIADLRPGDLLVYAYDTSDPTTIHHITMYIGGGQMVHAPHTGDVVRVVPVYLDGLYGAARPGVRGG